MKPRAITQLKTQIISNAVQLGASDEIAASAAQVPVVAIRDMLAAGEEIVQQIEDGTLEFDPDDEDSLPLEVAFYLEYHSAKWQFARRHLESVNLRAATDWRAATWLLGKLFPDTYGEKQSHKIQSQTDHTFSGVVDDLAEAFQTLGTLERAQRTGRDVESDYIEDDFE